MLLFLGSASIWSCGGRAGLESDGEDTTGFAGQSGAENEVAGGGRGGAQGRPEGVLDLEPMVQPPCVLGFSESRAGGRECMFVHDRRCYEDEVLACACACPMGGRCVIEGFLDPEGPFPVRCALQ